MGQGTTLVVPKAAQMKLRALAPEVKHGGSSGLQAAK
jgi:hypothetical protein